MSGIGTLRVNFILFVHVGDADFGFIDVQCLQNVVFSFEKGLIGQNHSLTDFYYPMKKSLPSPSPPPLPSPPSPLGGEISPYLFNAIWKALACFSFLSRGVEIIFTYFSVWLWTVTRLTLSNMKCPCPLFSGLQFKKYVD